MPAYPSIYRANAVKVEATSVTAFVPQVFGDVPIEIVDFIDKPSVTGLGWVFFQAGNPDFPVWSSSAGEAGDSDAGGGEDEVWVGPDDPIGRNPSVELWYDTNDNSLTALRVRVNDTWVNVNTVSGLIGITTPTKTTLGVGAATTVPSTGYNTAVGADAGAGITTGIQNVVIGDRALAVGPYADNGAVAIGSQALNLKQTGAGQGSVAIGVQSMLKTNLGGGTAVGAFSLFNQTSGVNTAIGNSAGTRVTFGNNNIFIGDNADLKDATQSSQTIALGGLSRVKGDYAIALGYAAEATATESIAIGHAVTTAVANEIKIGGASHSVKILGSLNVITLQALDSGGAATTININPSGGIIQLGSGNPQQVRIGNDAFFTDINVANSLALQGVADPTAAALQLGANAKVIGMSAYLQLTTAGEMYFDITSGNFNWRRTSDFTSLMTLDTAGKMTAYGIASNGAITAGTSISAGGNIDSNGQIYAGTNQWFRVRGNTGIYWEDWGGGWNMTDATWMRAYNNKGVYTPGEIRGGGVSCEGWFALSTYGNFLYLGPNSDANHRLNYSAMAAASVHPSSGMASNGPTLYGYSTAIIGTAAGQPYTNLLMTSNGDCFDHAGYKQFSQRKLKLDPKALDPEACLLQVRRWEPIEYTPIWPVNGDRRDGFIVEDLYEATPTVCNVIREVLELPGETDNDREWRLRENATREIGTPNAIDYPAMVVRLTGAVQALAHRIDALETELEGTLR